MHGPDNVRQQPRYLRFFIQTHHHIPPMFSMDSDYLTMREHPGPHEPDPNVRKQGRGRSPHPCPPRETGTRRLEHACCSRACPPGVSAWDARTLCQSFRPQLSAVQSGRVQSEADHNKSPESRTAPDIAAARTRVGFIAYRLARSKRCLMEDTASTRPAGHLIERGAACSPGRQSCRSWSWWA